MSDEEKNKWNELCLYVHKEILQYDDNQKFPTYLALRLKGLAQGKFAANNNSSNCANYNYDVLLRTFQFCKHEILRAKQSITFNGEQHLINYVMKIAERNINDVYMRMNQSRKTESKIETVNIDILSREAAEYVTNSNDTQRNKPRQIIEELW